MSVRNKDGKELWAGTFDLDPTASPKVRDHRSHESQKKGGDALGIYELDGDNLKVACVVGTRAGKEWRGKPRSRQFRLPDADVVIELRRGKPVKCRRKLHAIRKLALPGLLALCRVEKDELTPLFPQSPDLRPVFL